MKKLSDLNKIGGIYFTDSRPTEYTFATGTAQNQQVNVYENRTFKPPMNYDLIRLINPGNVALKIDLSNWSNARAVWSSNLSTTGTAMPITVANNVYLITGITSITDWTTATNVAISSGTNPPDSYSYTTTVTTGNVDHSFPITVFVNQLDQLTTPSDFYYQNTTTNTIINTPLVYDLGLSDINNSNLSLTITPSNTAPITSLSSTGTGGTSTFNSSTKVLTITGNLNQVNSRLGNITYVATSGADSTWIAQYALYNASSNFTTTISQSIKAQGERLLTYPTPFYYGRNVTNRITGYPQVVDTEGQPGRTYTLTVKSSTANTVATLSSSGSGGTSSFNSSTRVLTITGNKTQVNSHLATIDYTPVTDVVASINFEYYLTTSINETSLKLQNLYVTSDTNIVGNISVTRSFVTNTADQAIFQSNTPAIIETVTGANYVITLTSAAGMFGTNTATATQNYSFTGTKSAVNSLFSTIKFYPFKDVNGDQTAVYSQYRNGSLQSSTTFGLSGTSRSTEIPGKTKYTFNSSGTFTPTFEQAYYLTADILVVGGGGGGGGGSGFYGGGGGGAGGAQEVYMTLANLNTISITVGGGGAGTATQNYQPGNPGGLSRVTLGSGATITSTGGNTYNNYNTGWSGLPPGNEPGSNGYKNNPERIGAGSGANQLLPFTPNTATYSSNVAYGGPSMALSAVNAPGSGGSGWKMPFQSGTGAGTSWTTAYLWQNSGSTAGLAGIVVIRFY
jgi:hypothetical protein